MKNGLYKLFLTIGALSMLFTGCSKSSNNKGNSSSVSESEAIPSSSELSSSESELPPEPSSIENRYTITWENYDGTVLEVDNDVKEGTTPTYDGATPLKAEDAEYSYAFSGWTPKVVPAVADQTYTATFDRSKIEYTIDFNLNGGSSVSYDGPKKVTFFTKDVFFFDCVKEGWNFRGWSYQNTKIFDEKGNQLANPTMAKNMTFTALFSQTVKLSIVCNIPNAGVVTGEGEYQYNTNVDISAEANDGYKFVGWFVDNILISSTKYYNFKMWSEDVTIEARFMNNMHELHVESLNENKGLVAILSEAGANYAKEWKEHHFSTEEITIAAYTLDDVRFLGWFDKYNNLVDTNAVYKFVMPDDDYHLIAKWNYFTIDYELNGGTNHPENPDHYTLEDDTIYLQFPTRDGYEFAGWKIKMGEHITDLTIGFYADVAWNVTAIAEWHAESYDLTLSSNDYTKGDVELIFGTGEYGSSVHVNAIPKSNCTFIGWYDGNELMSAYADYTFTMPLGELVLTAHFMSDTDLGKKLVKSGDTATYGLFPQDKVTDSALKTKLNSLNPHPLNNYLYYEGAFYAQGESDYYKCSPLTWKVCGEFYMTEKIVASVQYYSQSTGTRTISGKTIYPSNYKYSDMRDYLIHDFIDMAFGFDLSKLDFVTVENGSSQCSGTSQYTVGDNTSDVVFLLSYKQFTSTAYGFESHKYDSDTRKATATDWAKQSGYYTNIFTRSPSPDYEGRVARVDSYDGSCQNELEVTLRGGIRPVVKFNA